ncbi:MAG: hypothetical protein LBG99_06580 [Propionibacteriaceae bacterium]|jgi:choline kinase|nr:hypothetical protein [Propionibacteriaceae bacterium]
MKPTLVILAAGMGSRYGGLKQIDSMGPCGEVILEYSIFDAVRAGFNDVVMVINPETEPQFRAAFGDRLASHVPLRYAYQSLGNLPSGFEVPEGRVKPWGTAHALLSAAEVVDRPFAVINADDFYGFEALESLAEFLARAPGSCDGACDARSRSAQDDNARLHLAMVGFRIEDTLSDHGSVSRGVCTVNAQGFLVGIEECHGLEPTETGARYTVDEQSWIELPLGTPVSMNLWGATPEFLSRAQEGFAIFLTEHLPSNPLTCEYGLPDLVERFMHAGLADVTVLSARNRWYGVTYASDKPEVQKAVQSMHDEGTYPTPLWGGDDPSK